ncbi:hypothetical protein [Saccharopolyspora hattusasensis]|uniref:hypothetical protein n=1 Tax=Saccharopolyspora hattusasensis TaxID=1128679 RepID=UPI003D98D450
MDSEDLLAFLGVVGHAQRRRVIAELADGRLYVSELHRHALPGRRRDLLVAGYRHDHPSCWSRGQMVLEDTAGQTVRLPDYQGKPSRRSPEPSPCPRATGKTRERRCR